MAAAASNRRVGLGAELRRVILPRTAVAAAGPRTYRGNRAIAVWSAAKPATRCRHALQSAR